MKIVSNSPQLGMMSSKRQSACSLYIETIVRQAHWKRFYGARVMGEETVGDGRSVRIAGTSV